MHICHQQRLRAIGRQSCLFFSHGQLRKPVTYSCSLSTDGVLRKGKIRPSSGCWKCVLNQELWFSILHRLPYRKVYCALKWKLYRPGDTYSDCSVKRESIRSVPSNTACCSTVYQWRKELGAGLRPSAFDSSELLSRIGELWQRFRSTKANASASQVEYFKVSKKKIKSEVMREKASVSSMTIWCNKLMIGAYHSLWRRSVFCQKRQSEMKFGKSSEVKAWFSCQSRLAVNQRIGFQILTFRTPPTFLPSSPVQILSFLKSHHIFHSSQPIHHFLFIHILLVLPFDCNP